MTTDNDNARVSSVYRDLAQETTPEGLDRRVLRHAAQESRTRYGLARAWMRPVAWAATIGLSLAFLLEMTWFADAPPLPEPAIAPPAAERARNDADVMKAKEEDAVRQAAPRQTDDAPNSTPAALMADEESALDEAGKRARTLVEENETPGAALYSVNAELPQFCGAEAHASAQSWYTCIEGLREQGREDEAAVELEALLETFPDFRVPPAE